MHGNMVDRDERQDQQCVPCRASEPSMHTYSPTKKAEMFFWHTPPVAALADMKLAIDTAFCPGRKTSPIVNESPFVSRRVESAGRCHEINSTQELPSSRK